MTDLRQQALKAVEEMPEKAVAALLPLLQYLLEKEDTVQEKENEKDVDKTP